MEYLYAIIAGLIQGLTEFLPVSSSGHLVVLHDFLKFDFIDNLAFDVVLHLGTFLALLLFFWPEVVKYFKAFFASFFDWNLGHDVNQKMAWYLFAATIPAALAGYLWQDLIETVFRSTQLVAAMLILVGVILYLADHFSQKIKSLDRLVFKDALVMGLAQALALIPGVSRSGITIIAGLTQKLNRQAAARFSFLLSMPVVFGAGVKKTYDLFVGQGVDLNQFWLLSLGFLAAAISGYYVIKYFLRFLQNHSLKVFAYYRVIFGLLLLIISWHWL